MSKSLKIGDLEVKIPVVQGGMGVGISLSGLAGNVSACGGLGVISTAQIGWREPDFYEKPFEANFRAIEKEIKKARELAKGGVLGVNIMVATQRYEEYVKSAVKAGIDIVISGAGVPIDLPKYVEGSKTKIAPIVSSLKSLTVICRMWERKYQTAPDLVVIEGPKAGGHLGFHREQLEMFTDETYAQEVKKILTVVREIEADSHKNIPVVLAGGIYDRADMDRALALGVDGVQMGTRFVTTYECDADLSYKQAYIDCKKEQIGIVKSPVGMPGRAIFNTFIKHGSHKIDKKCLHCLEHCNPKEIPYCITRALIAAAKGNLDEALLFCGANAWKAEKLEHVADIMEELK